MKGGRFRAMFSTGRDLPLGRDASSRFLVWIIGFMVILGSLALASAMLLSDVGRDWRVELAGKLTVQIMPEGDGGDADATALDLRVRMAEQFLAGQPGIAHVETLSDRRIAMLLEPWLGPRSREDALPIPKLIDVQLVPGSAVDISDLTRRLGELIPGSSIDDHGVWLTRLLTLTGAIETVALSILGLILLAAAATVVFTTRTGLAIHDKEIELLHLVGAEDQYIARQFQVHALTLSLKGGIAGMLVAAVALAALGMIGEGAAIGMIPPLTLSISQWLIIALLPLATSLIATSTARLTVMRSLAGMS
jgi:cell division transport system permease protein